MKLTHDCYLNWGSVRVDDTLMAETVHTGQPSGIQVAIDKLVRQAKTDKFQLNETKCEELQISFSRSADSFEAVTINNKPIQVVTNVKLLGLTISNNHVWNAHIENVIKKRFSRFYQLRQLKHAKEDPPQLVCFFSTCILPVSEYACQVFHNGLPKYLSEATKKLLNSAILPPSTNGANRLRSANPVRSKTTPATNYMAFCHRVILVPWP